MSNVVSIDEWLQRRAIEAMVVLCGTGKSTATWTIAQPEENVVKEPNK